MATTVASRFAVLSLDEDDDYSNRKRKTPNKKPAEAKPQNMTAVKSETNFKKKKKQNAQPQNVKSRNKSTNSVNNEKKKKEVSSDQWEEWKQKDAQFIEGNYEDELSQAILLSKLDYEEKKHFYESAQKNEEKKNSKKSKKNQKPANNEANNLGPKSSGENVRVKTSSEKVNQKAKGGDSNAKDKDNKSEEVNNKKKNREPLSQEAFIVAKFEDTIEKRDKEISQLKDEVEKLKAQLLDVKTRNKKLCQIIASGEMKMKAEVLMEVERLQTVKDELSSEIVNLHAQLMQERSKVRALSGNDHKSKDKNKKRNVHNADGNQ